jgi:hypothetical protein
VPFALGLNVYCRVQLWPPASAVFSAQVPPRVKSLGFAPPDVIEAMVSVPPPLLVKVTLFAALVVPTFWLPKLSVDALSVATAAEVAAAAVWVTVNVAPPTVRFALRCAPVLAATDQATVAFPVPLVAEVMVSQVALLLALHGQAAPTVSVKLPVPPPVATLALDGLSV